MNNNYLPSFSIREVFTVASKPGLWRVKSVSRAAGIAVMYRLIDDKQIINARIADIGQVVNMSLLSPTDKKMLSVSDVFDRIFDQENLGTNIPDNFDGQSAEIQRDYMRLILHDIDSDGFKISYFSKMLKWYADLKLAMSKMEPVVDPYDTDDFE